MSNTERKLRRTYTGANEVRFADPLNVLNTVRAKVTLGVRSSSTGMPYQGLAAELISSRKTTVGPLCTEKCSVPSTENKSVRTRISGSMEPEDKASLLQSVKDHITNLQMWVDADLAFLPDNVEFVIDKGIV